MSRRQLTVLRIEGGQMGRKVVVEIKCDRCARTEHLPANGSQVQGEEPIFEGSFQGVAVEFKDLCTSCKEIVAMRWNEIAKSLLKASPQRNRLDKLAKIEAAKPTAKLSPHGTSPKS